MLLLLCCTPWKFQKFEPPGPFFPNHHSVTPPIEIQTESVFDAGKGAAVSGAVGAASLSNPSQRGRTASAEALHPAAAARATSLVPVNVRSCACDGACGREKKHAATQAVVETWLSWRILGLEAGVA